MRITLLSAITTFIGNGAGRIQLETFNVFNIRIYRNKIFNNGNSRYIPLTHRTYIADVRFNKIIGNGNFGIDASIFSSGTTIISNNIQGSSYGIWGNSGLVIKSNNITGNSSFGIYLYNCSLNQITTNVIKGNGTGIYHDSGANQNTITHNLIASNSAMGIYYYNCSLNQAVSNVIKRNNTGIYFDLSSSQNGISHDLIFSNSQQGIYCASSATLKHHFHKLHLREKPALRNL